jgi:hypothetical protein
MFCSWINSLRTWNLVEREGSETYVLISLLSFAASVTVIRLFLSLTGYPQIGGGELHIAHVLWGGLILYGAALAPLILSNRRVYTLSAVFSGVGVGFFIDEVGKFITQKNDYFFPAAAPIIYVFFLLTVLLFLRVYKSPNASPSSELARALENLPALLDRQTGADHHAALERRLSVLAANQAYPRHARLARLMLEFVQSEKREDIQARPGFLRQVRDAISRRLSERSMLAGLVTGLVILGLLSLKNPAQIWLSGKALPLGIQGLLSIHFGRQIDPASAPHLFAARIWLETLSGLLLLSSAGLLLAARKNAGALLGCLALLYDLVTVDVTVFYFEQFSTLIMVVVQFLMILGLLYYRRRFLLGAAPTPVFIRPLIDGIDLGLPPGEGNEAEDASASGGSPQ